MESRLIKNVVYSPAENIPFKILEENDTFAVEGETFRPMRDLKTIEEAVWVLRDWLRKVAIETIQGADVEMINRQMRRNFSMNEIQKALLSKKMNKNHYYFAFKRIVEAGPSKIYIHID